MSVSSHSGEGLAEDEQDVVGQPVAGVLEQEPDHPLDRGAQVGQGQRRGYLVIQVEESPGAVPGLDQPVGVEQQPVHRAQASSGPTASRPARLKLGPINIPVTAMTASNTRAIMIHTGC